MCILCVQQLQLQSKQEAKLSPTVSITRESDVSTPVPSMRSPIVLSPVDSSSSSSRTETLTLDPSVPSLVATKALTPSHSLSNLAGAAMADATVTKYKETIMSALQVRECEGGTMGQRCR